ncbi:MAG: RNA polymerase sigma factor [Phycisphaerales bacterium]
MDRDDDELVACINGGDAAAFDVLYQRYRDWAFSLALRFVGGNHAAAFDVAQDAFLWLLRQFPGFELRAHMKTVLYPAVRNGAITLQQRTAARTKRERVHAVGETVAPTTATSPDHAELRAVVAELPEGQREVLLLRYADELQMHEIAAAMEIPLGTAKSRLHHALAALRENPTLKNLYFD